MASTGEVTIKVTADTTEAVREIRKLRREADALRIPAWCRSRLIRGLVVMSVFLNLLTFVIHLLVDPS